MSNNNRLVSADQETESFSLKNFLLLSLGYWKWFLLSIILFTGMGLFYIYTRQPIYERSEEILVKDQESGTGVNEVNNSFSQMGLFANSTKVYNELIAFTSPAVMYEVVQRLNLTMNYDRVDGLKRQTLYGTNLPVNIEFPDLSDKQDITLRLTLDNNGGYEISKLTKSEFGQKVKYEKVFKGKVGGPAIKTPVGTVEVKPNDAYIIGSIPDGEDVVIDVFKQSLQGTVEKYVAKLIGDLTDQDADVINLSIKDTSIERADDILNTVVTVYNERWIEDKNKVAIATSDFIAERLVAIEKELGNVDDKIADQKTEMQIPNMEEAARVYLEQGMAINEELLKTSTLLSMTQFLKDYLKDPANMYSILPMNTGTENMILEEQIAQYNELLLKRNNLAENSSDENPLVKDYNQQLAGIRNAIIRSIDSHISNLQSAMSNIDNAQANTTKELTETPKKAKKLLSNERQQLVMEELYLFLLQKREENQLSQTFTAASTRIITPPYGKMKPVSPKKMLLLVIFFLIGWIVPASALFIAESSNTKIRSKKDMENLPIPFAGEIPHIGRTRKWLKIFQTKKRKQKIIDRPKIVVAEGKRDIPNEAFRVVRSNIDFMLDRNEHHALALTSFNPGSGKSFVAYNLGASFALKGKKVLVIDGDLRHGSISGYVNSPRKGLSTYLTGNEHDWKKLVRKADGMEGLFVLPIGHRPPNPAELLESPRLKTLIDEAVKDYDIVLIDCPPINIVVDTQIINQYVSRTIFVVRAGLLERQALRELVALDEEKKLKNISILLNGTTTEFSSYHTYGNYEAIDKA